ANEHENKWTGKANSYTQAAEVDDAMDGSWMESTTGEPGQTYVMAVDLGAVHDPSVIGVAHSEDGLVGVDRLVTFSGTREHPVQFAAVEAALVELAQAFPPSRILVESWQGLAVVQSLQRRGWPVEVFTPTAPKVAAQWGTLAQYLASRRLVLPEHPRLR